MKEIDLNTMNALVKQGNILVVDVREDEEVEAGMIPGAKHMPLSRFDEFKTELSAASDVIFYCRSGRRSLKACELAEPWNKNCLYSLAGGYLAYADENPNR